MKDRFIRLTTGWIPVSVLLLFAAALVYGGNGANPAERRGPDGTRAAFPLSIKAAVPDTQAIVEFRISPLYE
jgi:hypothetical protein